MSKPFFYRITAADFLAAVVTVPAKQRGQWCLDLALDMVAGNADTAKSEFAKAIIIEATEFRTRKANAGAKGGLAKASSAKAVVGSAVAKPSIPLASSSSSSSSSTVTEPITEEPQPPTGDDDQFYKMKELSALAVKYLGWNGNLSQGQAEQLRPLTSIFKAEVDFGFNAAASANAKSIAYVIKAAGNNSSSSQVDTTEFERLLEASR